MPFSGAGLEAMGFQGASEAQVAQLRNTQAQTRLHQANTQLAEQQAAQQMMQQQLLQDAGRGVGIAPDMVPNAQDAGDPTAHLRYIAKIQEMSGDIKGSVATTTAAAGIESKRMSDLFRMSEVQKNQLTIQKERTQTAEQYLHGVKSQEDLDSANLEYFRRTGEVSPYAGEVYSPERMQTLSERTLTANQMLEQQLKTNRDFLANEVAKSKLEFYKHKSTLMDAEEVRKQAREARLSKVGGKVVGDPSTTSVTLAYSRVAKAFPGLSDDEKLTKAYAVASKAKTLKMAHPGMDSAEALQQALQSMSKEPGVTYQDGKTPGSALPAPIDMKFEAGKYYHTPKGILQFTGKGFRAPGTPVVEASSGLPSLPGFPNTEDDTEEE